MESEGGAEMVDHVRELRAEVDRLRAEAEPGRSKLEAERAGWDVMAEQLRAELRGALERLDFYTVRASQAETDLKSALDSFEAERKTVAERDARIASLEDELADAVNGLEIAQAERGDAIEERDDAIADRRDYENWADGVAALSAALVERGGDPWKALLDAGVRSPSLLSEVRDAAFRAETPLYSRALRMERQFKDWMGRS